MNLDKFLRTFSKLRRRLNCVLTDGMNPIDREKCAKRIDSLLSYNVAKGKCQRALLLVDSYCALQRSPSEHQLSQAIHLAWTMELMQSFFLVLDDIADGGEVRRGEPCWHTLPEIGLSAVNDAQLLDTAVDIVVADSFGSSHLFEPITCALRQTKQLTLSGQIMDSVTDQFEDCTMRRYWDIATRKTAHYTFFTPVQLALLLADHRAHCASVQQISYNFGCYFQSQDDYLDCFGDSSVTGKVGTDLRDKKCTWVTATAQELTANDTSMRRKFQENFGKDSNKSASILRNLLEELRIPNIFEKFENEERLKLINEIESLAITPLRSIFQSQLDNLYKRKR